MMNKRFRFKNFPVMNNHIRSQESFSNKILILFQIINALSKAIYKKCLQWTN